MNGKWINGQYVPNNQIDNQINTTSLTQIQYTSQYSNTICPKCNSHNINAQVVNESAKEVRRNRGCLYASIRLMLIICTCGLWLLVPQSDKTSKTTYKQKTVWICQDCGYTWKA